MRERENGERGERGSLPLTGSCINGCHSREEQSRGRGSGEQHERQRERQSLSSSRSRGRGSRIGARTNAREQSKREESESREREPHERRARERRENGERAERERRGERRALLLERSEQRITESLPEADRGRGLSPSLGAKDDESVDVVKCHERRGERTERGEERRD
jgi:hypothetical protein